MGSRQNRIRIFRKCGRKHKHNKKSVAFSKKLKRLEARRKKKE